MSLSLRGMFGGGRRLRVLGAPVLLALLAACGGTVGNGNAPKTLFITTPSATTIANVGALQTFECLTYALAAFLQFTDGESGNFTSRIVWSSDDTNVVQVSNGDIPVADLPGAFYAAGTVIPVSPGTAVVTGDYYGITSQVVITVNAPTSILVKTVVQNNPVVPSGNAFVMGIGTTQDLVVTALLNNVESDISQYADWSFQQPNTSIATIVPLLTASGGRSGGRITAVGQGGPLLPVASFPTCPLDSTLAHNNAGNNGPTADLSFAVQHIQSIALQPEFAGNPQLIVGNTEKFFVQANLANGQQQEISLQSSLTSSNPSILAFDTAAPISNLLVAVASGGPAVIGATFQNGGTVFQAPSLTVSAVNGVLGSFSVCYTPVNQIITSCPASQPNATMTAGRLTELQYHAIGSFDSGTVNQEITRQVSWSSGSPTVANLNNGPAFGGIAIAGTQTGSAIITVSDSSASNIPAQTEQIIVNAP